MAGVGVRHQSAALASQVASILSNRLVRSVRWQLLAKSGVNTRQALEFVKDRELLPADVLVTALGTNDVTSQKKPYQFISDYEALVDVLLTRIGARFAVVSGLPPLHLTPTTPQPLRWYLGRYAHLLDEGGRLLLPDHAILPRLSDHFAHGREPDIYSGGRERLHAGPPLR
jgi:GDSL-like Lipase/Acylhydrolase family